MIFFRFLFLCAGIASLVFMVVGLHKPWTMLWWEAVQTRRKVIGLYGSISVLSFVLYWMIKSV